MFKEINLKKIFSVNETFLELPVEYEVPSEGRIFARFTAIESVDTFYVHLIKFDRNLARKHINTNMEMTLMDLLIHMNEPEERKSYRQLSGQPNVGQIVIAPFNDQNFYRAKVFSIDVKTAEALVSSSFQYLPISHLFSLFSNFSNFFLHKKTDR